MSRSFLHPSKRKARKSDIFSLSVVPTASYETLSRLPIDFRLCLRNCILEQEPLSSLLTKIAFLCSPHWSLPFKFLWTRRKNFVISQDLHSFKIDGEYILVSACWMDITKCHQHTTKLGRQIQLSTSLFVTCEVELGLLVSEANWEAICSGQHFNKSTLELEAPLSDMFTPCPLLAISRRLETWNSNYMPYDPTQSKPLLTGTWQLGDPASGW